MSLPKGSFNSGIKNLTPFSKGKSGYHFKKRKVLCQFCEKEFISTVQHAKFCSPKCRDRCRPNRQPKGYKKQLISGKASKTKKGISENIRREKHAHPEMPIKQAVAIAYSTARGGKKRKKK